MSYIKNLAIESHNRETENERAYFDLKLQKIDKEEAANKFANKFEKLEEDYYEAEERAYKMELKHQFDSYQILNVI